MSISFFCTGCGKPFTTGDETAGKRAVCKRCGQQMVIPHPDPDRDGPSAVDPYGLAEDIPDEPPASGPSPTRAAASSWPTRPAGPGSESASKKTLKTAMAIAVVVGGMGLKVYSRIHRFQRPAAPAASARASAVDRDGPIETPPLPGPGPGVEVEPGIMLHEVRLPGGDKPGFGGKLWLYLPEGEHPPGSLPCVMITGAGSNLIVGMDLGENDRPEHLPYARAGFAVLAYELDGAVPNLREADPKEMERGIFRFLAARAGLVNAHVALQFLLEKVPQVDPRRIYTAGHSSAGTTAMLFAENEPAIRGCVAYAPAIDLVKRFGPEATQAFRKDGIDDLVLRYSPMNNESKLRCPILLFHARDDSTVPVADTEASAGRLRALGKSVTLVTVPTGDHYDSMIREGIPRGIAWLRDLAGLPPAESAVVATPPDEPPAQASTPPIDPARTSMPPGASAPPRVPRPSGPNSRRSRRPFPGGRRPG